MKFWLVNEKYIYTKGEWNYFCIDSIKVGELGTELGIGIDCKLKFKDLTLCVEKLLKKPETLQRIPTTLCAKKKMKNHLLQYNQIRYLLMLICV